MAADPMSSHRKNKIIIQSVASARFLQLSPARKSATQQPWQSGFKLARLSRLWRTSHPAGCAGIHRTWGDVFLPTSNQGRHLKKQNTKNKHQDAAHGRHRAFVLTRVDGAREVTMCSAAVGWGRFIPATKRRRVQKWSHIRRQRRVRQLHCGWLRKEIGTKTLLSRCTASNQHSHRFACGDKPRRRFRVLLVFSTKPSLPVQSTGFENFQGMNRAKVGRGLFDPPSSDGRCRLLRQGWELRLF